MNLVYFCVHDVIIYSLRVNLQARGQVDRRVIVRDTNLSRGSDAEIERDRGVYVGVDEESDTENGIVDDGLEDIWNEMSMGLEFSKVS